MTSTPSCSGLNGLAPPRRCSSSPAGLSLIFGVTRIVNFAHGSFYMLGIYVAYSSPTKLGGGRSASGAACCSRPLVGRARSAR